MTKEQALSFLAEHHPEVQHAPVKFVGLHLHAREVPEAFEGLDKDQPSNGFAWSFPEGYTDNDLDDVRRALASVYPGDHDVLAAYSMSNRNHVVQHRPRVLRK